jgi:hypothetical protein
VVYDENDSDSGDDDGATKMSSQQPEVCSSYHFAMHFIK